MLTSNTVNELHSYLKEDVLELAKVRNQEIESVSFGEESGSGFKNDIFVSFACTNENHGDSMCMCQEILNQSSIVDKAIDLEIAEKIAHYVSGLIGGRRVYKG